MIDECNEGCQAEGISCMACNSLRQTANEFEKLNKTMERIADDLDTVIAGATLDSLKGLGKGIWSLLEGLLDKAEITNGSEEKAD